MNKYTNIFKIIATIALVVLITVLFRYYNLSQYLGLDGFNKYALQIMAIKNNYPSQFIAVYIAGYFTLIVMCIPGTIMLDILAGFLFGVWGGTVLVTISYTIATIGNYFLVHYLLHDFFIKRLEKFKINIVAENQRQKFMSLTALRLVPVIPFWALNILASVLKIRFNLFILSTIIGILPSTIIYATVGEGTRDTILAHAKLNPQALMNPKIWLPLVLLSILTILPSLIKYIRKQAN